MKAQRWMGGNIRMNLKDRIGHTLSRPKEVNSVGKNK